MTIKVYQHEINDGIGELVKSTASVAYCSEASVRTNVTEADVIHAAEKIVA